MSLTKVLHYTAVLADLKTERKELDALITHFERRLAVLQNPRTPEKDDLDLTITFETQDSVSPTNTNRANDDKPKLGVMDTAYSIINLNRIPIHAKELLTRVHAAGHLQTTIKSLTGGMPQDGKKRFENLGRNMWALKEWPEDFKEYHRNKINPPTTEHQNSLLNES